MEGVMKNPPMYDYQYRALRWLCRNDGRGLLAIDMRLGKTRISLEWLKRNKRGLPALVVCPATIKHVWEEEISKWTDFTCAVVGGRKTKRENPWTKRNVDILIINYDVLFHWRRVFRQFPAQTIIFDESHYMSNPEETKMVFKTKRVRAGVEVANHVPHVICLSGTPIKNRPCELFPVLHILDYENFRKFWPYAIRYCDLKYGRFDWDWKGSGNLSELKEKIEHIVLRIRKKDVLDQLPDKVTSAIPVDLSNRKEYKKAEDDFISWLEATGGNVKGAKKAQALMKINELKRMAGLGKVKAINDWIKNYLKFKGKLVVFTSNVKPKEAILSDFSDSVGVDGQTPLKRRQEAVEAFQRPSGTSLFVGTMKACGEGIRLDAGNVVCFAEMDWTPSIHDQAADRVWNKDKDKIDIIYFIAKNTVEERVLELLNQKREVMTSLIDGGDIDTSGSVEELLLETFRS